MTTQPTTGNRAGVWFSAVGSVSGLAGIGYTVAWAASLAIGAPNPSVAASGGQVLVAFAGHGSSAIAMFVLAEGIAAIAMFLLAAMAVALGALSVTSAMLPRWLAPFGLLLAASLVVSGLGYVLLTPSVAASVNVAGVLLLAVVTATGVTMGVRARVGADHADRAERTAASR